MKKHIKLYEEFQEEFTMFKTRFSIEEWLQNIGLIDYSILEDNSVNVNGESEDVNLKGMLDGYIPVQFGSVSSDFDCSKNGLTSLKGCPKVVGGGFNCRYNPIKTLEFCPKEIESEFNVQDCKLMTLILAPKEPWDYDGNPCTSIYDELGFTDEAHIKSLLVWGKQEPEEMTAFVNKLKDPDKDPSLYEKILQNKELRIIMGLEDVELEKTYKKVSDVEKGYF